jgi:AraC-like DNA-binding protein
MTTTAIMDDASCGMREYPVHATLAPFVKCIWSQESSGPIFGEGRERILPDSCVELVIHFRDPFVTYFADGTSAVQPQSFVAGQMKRFLEIEPAGRIGIIAIRFRACGAYLFFQRPLSEVAAGIVDLGDVWKEQASELTERIAMACGMRARVQIIEEVLIGLLSANGRYDRTVDQGLKLIDANRGQLNVAQLAAHLGISNRQLTRRFQHAVGLSPKEFTRVSRFLHVVRSLSDHEPTTLTETALACGYYDQAHFNHEFREMAGMAPSEFFSFPNVVF